MVEELGTEQLIERGREAYARGAYALALSDLQAAVRRAPAFADVHHLVGICYCMLGNPEAGIAAFGRALELNPRYVEARMSRAITLNDLGRHAEARSDFEAASEVDLEEGVGTLPSVAAAKLANKHAELGDLYTEAGALDEAIEAYRRALELRPRFVDIRNRLSRALLEAGDADGARTELEAILDINPAFLSARVNLGLARYRAGDLEGARREWERALAQSPAHPAATSFLRMIENR